MNIVALTPELTAVAVFDADIEVLEDLDPEFAQERLDTLSGEGRDTPDISEMVFFELKDGITFEKHVHYSVNAY